MNDRVRNINCMLNILKTKRDTRRNNIDSIWYTDTDQQLYSECLVFIDKIKQVRHSKSLLRRVNKFKKLKLKQRQWGIQNRLNVFPNRQFNNNRTQTQRWDNHTNDNNHNTSVSDITNKWVVNLSSTPLTEGQASLLARDPNLPLYPNTPPKGDYVTAVEEVCHQLLPKWQQS